MKNKDRDGSGCTPGRSMRRGKRQPPRRGAGGREKEDKGSLVAIGVSHDLSNRELGASIADEARDKESVALVEGSLYLGGFLPNDAQREDIRVLLEPPSVLTEALDARSLSLMHLYSGGREIAREARGHRRLFETIASELESAQSMTDRRRLACELLKLRRRFPDLVVYNEPKAWLRTVWYEADLLLDYLVSRDRYRLFGAFIYSEMDADFASFLGKYGTSVSAMTGDSCLLFSFDGEKRRSPTLHDGAEYLAYRVVSERPGRFEGAPSAAELDEQRGLEERMLSEIVGINRSILFGAKLGVSMEQTPCLTFWRSLEEKRSVTFSFARFKKDPGALSEIMKKLADVTRDVVSGEHDDVLAALEAQTGALLESKVTETAETIGACVGAFLRENSPPSGVRLYIDDLDNFSAVREIRASDVAGMLDSAGYLDVSEDEVQQVLERALDVPFHKKDWGGETNDLYTANVRVNGVRLASAFLLKGNGLKRKEMRIADCGKNGDQLVRLFSSPAQLFVVQFVGNVAEAVVSDAESKVAERRASERPGWFLVMDGQDTARVLSAYG